jgi:hypothetical protein
MRFCASSDASFCSDNFWAHSSLTAWTSTVLLLLAWSGGKQCHQYSPDRRVAEKSINYLHEVNFKAADCRTQVCHLGLGSPLESLCFRLYPLTSLLDLLLVFLLLLGLGSPEHPIADQGKIKTEENCSTHPNSESNCC